MSISLMRKGRLNKLPFSVHPLIAAVHPSFYVVWKLFFEICFILPIFSYSRQLKGFVDNRNSTCTTNIHKCEVNKVIQNRNLMIQMADSTGYKKAYKDAIATGNAQDINLGYAAKPPTKSKWDGDNTTWHHIIPSNELSEKNKYHRDLDSLVK